MKDNNETAALKKLGDALAEIEETSRQETDGKWLERLAPDCAPLNAEWDVREAWTWDEWPEKDHHDSGIDLGTTVNRELFRTELHRTTLRGSTQRVLSHAPMAEPT